MAIARKILVAVWHMLSNDEDFIDVYLRGLAKEAEEHRQKQESIQRIELSMVN